MSNHQQEHCLISVYASSRLMPASVSRSLAQPPRVKVTCLESFRFMQCVFWSHSRRYALPWSWTLSVGPRSPPPFPMAEKLLGGEIPDGSTVKIDEGDGALAISLA